MTKRYKLVLWCAIIFLVSVGVIFIMKSYKEKEMIMRVDGFEIEYERKYRNLTEKDFQNVKLGDSIDQIIEEVGNPDGWIGGGILRPVFVLKDCEKAVVCYFEYPQIGENLKKIAVFREDEVIDIIKEQ